MATKNMDNGKSLGMGEIVDRLKAQSYKNAPPDRWTPWNRCDICGRFISMEDFQSGRAVRTMFSPDSDRSSEDWETLCPEHASSR